MNPRRLAQALSCTGMFFVLAGTGGSAANAQALAPRAEHFERTKEYALRVLSERIRILESERRCIQAAHSSHTLRECHEGAKGDRASVQRLLQPQYEHLKRTMP